MAAFFGAIVSLSGGWWVGLIPAAMLAVPGTLIEVQACWRLHRTLFAFAKEVGGRPETRSSWDGRQAARWEAPPVAIEGKVGHYRLVPKIETITVTAGDRSWTIEPGKGRMGAREALVKLGRRSVAGSWEGEVPGPGPVVASLVGASWSGIFGGGVTLWLLDLFGLFAMPWTLAGAVPVVAIAAYCGSYNRRSREALAGLVEGVRAAGTTVADVTHTSGRVAPAYDLYTPEGVVDLTSAWPSGGFVARFADEDDEIRSVQAPFDEARDAGRRIGEAVREAAGW